MLSGPTRARGSDSINIPSFFFHINSASVQSKNLITGLELVWTRIHTKPVPVDQTNHIMLSRALLLPPLPIPQDPPLQTLLRTNHNPASSITNNPDQIRFSHIIIQSYTSPMSRDDSRLQLSSHNVISCKMQDRS